MGWLLPGGSISLSPCAAHLVRWLKESFGKVVLSCNAVEGGGGTVGWCPQGQFVVPRGSRLFGEIDGCEFYLFAGDAGFFESFCIVLDVAFGAEAPFNAYTEARLVALPRPFTDEEMELRRLGGEQSAGCQADALLLRLRDAARK